MSFDELRMRVSVLGPPGSERDVIAGRMKKRQSRNFECGLNIYRTQAAATLKHYRGLGELRSIDATRSHDDIAAGVIAGHA